MSEIEFAIMQWGEIINVITTSGGLASAQEVADRMTSKNLTVVRLDSLPLVVKQRYQYWDERP